MLPAKGEENPESACLALAVVGIVVPGGTAKVSPFATSSPSPTTTSQPLGISTNAKSAGSISPIVFG